MDIISLLVVLVVIGLVWWLLTTYVPMPQPVRMIVTVIGVLILCVWLLSLVGVGGGLHGLRLG